MKTNQSEDMQIYKKPIFSVPQGACDCHHHIYDPDNFPYSPDDTRNQPPSTIEEYQNLLNKMGLSRSVIVNPSAYGLDNSCTIAALKKMGKNARAVVTIDEKITTEEIKEMNDLGVCGVRFNFVKSGEVDHDTIKKIADKISSFNWHICFWISPDLIVELEDLFYQLPCDIVFDHRGHLPADQGVRHKAFQVICRLIENKKAWVKISGAYHDSSVGWPSYSDTVAVGKAYIQHDSSRVLWGTDWPHPSVYSSGGPIPDTVTLLDLLTEHTDSKEIIEQILVKNPEVLYKF